MALSDTRLPDAFMLQQVELRKFPPPSEHDVENISNWHWNHSHCAISKEEQQYLTHVHDLFSLVPWIKTPLRRLVDKSRRFKMHWLWRQEKVPQLPLYDREEIFYVSDRKIDRLMTVIIITIGTVMLIAPMCAELEGCQCEAWDYYCLYALLFGFGIIYDSC